MPKVNYNEWMNEDPFHPCLKCGAVDFQLDNKTDLYVCGSCGEVMVEPTLIDNPKRRDGGKKKVRLDEDDWE